MKSLKGKKFLGIDLSFPNKPSACLIISQSISGVNCHFYGFLSSDGQIMELVQRYNITITAIDAPLALPLGLCCLEESCSCIQKSLRSSEVALAQLGFPCFFTTKKSIIKPLVYRGIALRQKLEKLGFQVIETYPYAIRKILWGEHPRKNSKEGQAFLTGKLKGLLGLDLANHHLIDAALAAYTAYLYLQGRTIALGNKTDGEIIIPNMRLERS